MTDMNRYSLAGVVIMALGVALSMLAEKMSKGSEKAYYSFRLGGLFVAMIGTIVAVKLF